MKQWPRIVKGSNQQWIQIGPGEILDELNVSHTFQQISVSRKCVSIHEFARFTAATGYQSDGERSQGRTFFANELVEHLTDAEREDAPAFCLTVSDIERWLEWAGEFRLPTEAEWLAAALLDRQIYNVRRKDYCPWRGAAGVWRMQELWSAGAICHSVGNEVTSTIEDGCHVARCGPLHHLEPDWKDLRGEHRTLLAEAEIDLFTCFRVVSRVPIL